jgi:hypothetical protein
MSVMTSSRVPIENHAYNTDRRFGLDARDPQDTATERFDPAEPALDGGIDGIRSRPVRPANRTFNPIDAQSSTVQSHQRMSREDHGLFRHFLPSSPLRILH